MRQPYSKLSAGCPGLGLSRPRFRPQNQLATKHWANFGRWGPAGPCGYLWVDSPATGPRDSEFFRLIDDSMNHLNTQYEPRGREVRVGESRGRGVHGGGFVGRSPRAMWCLIGTVWLVGWMVGASDSRASCGHYVWDRFHWGTVHRGTVAFPADAPRQAGFASQGSEQRWLYQVSLLAGRTAGPIPEGGWGIWQSAYADEGLPGVPCRGPNCDGDSSFPVWVQVWELRVPDDSRVTMIIQSAGASIGEMPPPAIDRLRSETLAMSPVADLFKPPCC
jgi:hypothetical protein